VATDNVDCFIKIEVLDSVCILDTWLINI
jgi:hypothetical protein